MLWEDSVGNIQRLTQAGVIMPGATLTQDDQKLINGLSEAEVSALISISEKLTPDFVQRHLSGGGGGAASAAQGAIGIVF